MYIRAYFNNAMLKKEGISFFPNLLSNPEVLAQVIVTVRYNLRKIATMAKKLSRNKKIHAKALTIGDRMKMMKNQGMIIEYKGLINLDLDLIPKWVETVDEILSDLASVVSQAIVVLKEVETLLSQNQTVLAFSMVQQNGHMLPSAPVPLVVVCMRQYFALPHCSKPANAA
jgi:hypothetical protein